MGLQSGRKRRAFAAWEWVIYVLALVGKGPYKVEVTEEPTSDALLIADRIVSAVGPYHLPPTIAPIKIPDIAVPHNDLDAVAVSVNGTYMGPTFCVANVRDLALETYRAEKNVDTCPSCCS